MKLNILAVAALAAAAFCMSACANVTSAQIDSGFTSAQTVFMAAKSTVDADAQAGIIKAATATQIDGYITAGDLALSAAQAAFAAHDATTEQQKVADVMTATAQINAAILTAVAAYSSR